MTALPTLDPAVAASLAASRAADLVAASARLDLHAATVRQQAALLARHGAAMRWESPAARTCRARLDTLVAALLGWCRTAEALAGELRVQATIVRAAR